jgi:hypothetical protein
MSQEIILLQLEIPTLFQLTHNAKRKQQMFVMFRTRSEVIIELEYRRSEKTDPNKGSGFEFGHVRSEKSDTDKIVWI